uniref:Uncharacterized protein n=1 Tax=Ciona savignyi TaxID=51511 RepID=H2YB15_CIOSA
MVINGDDPELLFRLFDTVEPQNRPTGNKIKRGRPKKTPREMPPPRLILDNNPCIIQSITEKLFPKLTINRSCVSMHAVEKPVTVDDEYGCSLISEVEDYSTIGLYAFGGKSNLLEEDADTAEDNTNVTSSTPMISRMTSLSLPQLSINQDYSQLLTEVAAVL